MIKTAIDTDAIGKYIWAELYKISTKKGITQTELSKKSWVQQSTISSYFYWKKTTKNVEQYYRIAEAIPLTRREFDQIVEDAKEKVLWSKSNNDDPDIAYATLARHSWVSPDDVKKAIEMYKLYQK